MNKFALHRQQQDKHALIREIGSRIRYEGLDFDPDKSEEDKQAHDKAAGRLFSDYEEADIETALGFSRYLASLSDPKCAICSGRGAILLTGGDGTAVRHLGKDGKTAIAVYDPCNCARRAERVNKEAAPLNVSHNKHREADLDKRIAEAKQQQLARATDRAKAATRDLDARIQEADKQLLPFTGNAENAAEDLAYIDRNIEAIQKEQAQLRQRLGDLDSALTAAHDKRKEAWTHYDNCRAAESEAAHTVFDLTAQRERVWRHHAPKIDRAKRLLKRLTYLKTGRVSESEVEVTVQIQDKAEVSL